MKRIKATLALAISALAIAGALCACAAPGAKEADAKTQIVCTVFPAYDWTMNILGESSDDIEVTYLLDSGVDMHSYQPTADDMITLSTCDLLIYVGGESDAWIADALKNAANPDMTAISLIQTLGGAAKAEEAVEGMQAEAEEEAELDEHVWLSLKNAKTLCGAIADALCAREPERAEEYRANAEAYISALDGLDGEYAAAVKAAAHDTLVFGDRFPFRYLVDDYGIKYFAAFPGCSAETEASFETVAFLAQKVDELGLKSVIAIEGAKHRIAETIIQNTADKNQLVLTMDSMQAVTAEGAAEGKSYISIMRANLDALKTALN